MMNFLKNAGVNPRARSARGFALLIAVILTSVILSIGLALLDVSLKQVTLASSARQSQYAFYNADSVLECALYYDSIDTFDYTIEPASGSISCQGQTFNYVAPTVGIGLARTTTFTVPCTGGGASDGVGDMTIVKQSSGATHFYANGYNTCVASAPSRVERGEEAQY